MTGAHPFDDPAHVPTGGVIGRLRSHPAALLRRAIVAQPKRTALGRQNSPVKTFYNLPQLERFLRGERVQRELDPPTLVEFFHIEPAGSGLVIDHAQAAVTSPVQTVDHAAHSDRFAAHRQLQRCVRVEPESHFKFGRPPALSHLRQRAHRFSQRFLMLIAFDLP